MTLVHVFDAARRRPDAGEPDPQGVLHIRLGDRLTVIPPPDFPVYTAPRTGAGADPVAFTEEGVLGGSLSRRAQSPACLWPITLSPDTEPVRVLALQGDYVPSGRHGGGDPVQRRFQDEDIADGLYGMPAPDVVVAPFDPRECTPFLGFCARHRVPLVIHSGDGGPLHVGATRWVSVGVGGEVFETL